jgi:hypothetical protein
MGLLGVGLALTAQETGKPILVINEDNSHFFGSRTAEQMNRTGLHQFVDQYADSEVTHLFLCPNAMRANFASKVRDSIWAPRGDKAAPGRWPANAKLLHDKGLDAYAVWIARCREKGISPWLSMRMNDVHNVPDVSNYMHATFWREHPEFWRVPNNKGGAWTDRALNYAHREVREYEMAFLKELLERYDPDGIELDWMRFGRHLTPGKEREEGHILTEFMRQARALTEEWSKKRGHPIALAARVPAHPDAAVGLGMDGVTWAKEGLVDWLVPCPFWSSTDFDIPVELWKQRLGDAKVRVTPGAEFNARPWPGGKPVRNDVACLAGFAASAWKRGADGIYLFNWMDSGTRPVPESAYRTLIQRGLGPDVVAAELRRYPVCYRDTVPSGFPNGASLPITGKAGGTCRVAIGPAPKTGKAWVIAGLAGSKTLAAAALQVQVNGQATEAVSDFAHLAQLGGDSKRALRFAVPLGILQPGHNEIRLIPEPGSEQQKVVWVEMRIEP